MPLNEEEILMEFADSIQDIDNKKFDSKFISIYHELIKHYRISGALKAGSFGKGTIVDLKGDLDIIFTIDNPEITNIDDFRNDLAKKLKLSFPTDHVERKDRSVFIKFRKNLSVDVVYLTRDEFEKEKGQIKHIKSINKKIRCAIILIKYWKIKNKIKRIKSYKVEWNTLYSSQSELKSKIIDSLSQFGIKNQAGISAYNFMLNEAKKYQEEILD